MLQSFPLVRLAALDLDGTLLNRNDEVTLATSRHASARPAGLVVVWGVAIVPATGRPLASLPPGGAVSCPASATPSPPTVPPCGTWAMTRMAAVHSRYANAAPAPHQPEPRLPAAPPDAGGSRPRSL